MNIRLLEKVQLLSQLLKIRKVITMEEQVALELERNQALQRLLQLHSIQDSPAGDKAEEAHMNLEREEPAASSGLNHDSVESPINSPTFESSSAHAKNGSAASNEAQVDSSIPSPKDPSSQQESMDVEVSLCHTDARSPILAPFAISHYNQRQRYASKFIHHQYTRVPTYFCSKCSGH